MKNRKAILILLCVLLNAGFYPAASAQVPFGPAGKAIKNTLNTPQKILEDIRRKTKEYAKDVTPKGFPGAKTDDVDKLTQKPYTFSSLPDLKKVTKTSLFDAEMKASRKSFQELYEGLFNFPVSSGQFTRARVFTPYNPALASHFYFAYTDLTLCNSSIEDGIVVAIIPDEDSEKTAVYVYGNGYLYQYEGHIIPSVKEGDVVKPKAKLGTAKSPGVLSFYISRPGTDPVPGGDSFPMFLNVDEATPLSLVDKEYRSHFPASRTYSVYLDCVAIEDNALWEKKASALSKRLAEMDPSRSRKEWKDALSRARTKNMKFFLLQKDIPLAEAFSLCGSGKERLRKDDGLIFMVYEKPRTNF